MYIWLKPLFVFIELLLQFTPVVVKHWEMYVAADV